MSCEHVARDLDAYLDRELDPESAMIVREHLTRCAACRRHLAEREGLSRFVRAAPYYTAPDRLRARVLAVTTRAQPVRRRLVWATAAAAVLIASVGGGIGLWRSMPTADRAIADQLVDSHVRSLMANHLFDVESTDQHTVKPWFQGRLDFSPPVVDLASHGFPLAGGRLDYLGGRPVAALVYQRNKHTINVFVSPERDQAFTRDYVQAIRGFHVHHWVRDDMSFWAVSDLNDAELTEFVDALRSA